MQPLSTVECNV